MTDTRPRRSVLYMPGSNARAIDKARTLPADGIIIDLEDAVAPEAKDGARAEVAAAVRKGGFGRREVVIRVNGPDTPWGEDDIAAAARGRRRRRARAEGVGRGNADRARPSACAASARPRPCASGR